MCRSRYSARYALIELLTAFLFLGVFLQYRFLWAMPTYLVFTALLLICTFTDIDHWAILDRVSLGGAAAGVLFALLIPHLPRPIVTAAHSAISGAGEVSPAWAQWSKWIVAYAGPAPAGEWWGPAANSLVGALAGASFLWVIGLVGSLAFRKPAMGFGDVKLLLLIGAFTGWKIALLSIFLASVFGSVYGLTVLALDRIEGRRARARAGPGDGAEMLAEIEAVLDDGSESARRRGWAFSAREKAALTRILSAPKSVGEGVRHHLPFGPHLALAAWLLMAFAPQVTREIERFFSLRY